MKKRKVKCPHCKETITLDLDLGTQQKCTECRESIIIDLEKPSKRTRESETPKGHSFDGSFSPKKRESPENPKSPESETTAVYEAPPPSRKAAGSQWKGTQLGEPSPKSGNVPPENVPPASGAAAEDHDTEEPKIRVVQSTQMSSTGGSLYTVKEFIDIADKRRLVALRKRKKKLKQLRIAALILLSIAFVLAGSAFLKSKARPPTSGEPVTKPALP